jgi:ribose 5-phosphate isomerase A
MDVEAARQAAADAALKYVRDGMVLGLGTGRTASLFVEGVGRLVAQGMKVKGVPTSIATEQLAQSLNIPLIHPGEYLTGVDLAVDGADQVDSKLRLIKGYGGAMVRERQVEEMAKKFVVIVDEAKLVDRLHGPVPVEISSGSIDEALPLGNQVSPSWMGYAAPEVISPDQTLAQLAKLKVEFIVRDELSDNGNILADGQFGEIRDPERLAERISAIAGVVGHGIFIDLADEVLVGKESGEVSRLRA